MGIAMGFSEEEKKEFLKRIKMPPVTDAPLNPQEFIDSYKLKQEYKKAYEEGKKLVNKGEEKVLGEEEEER